MNEIWVRRLIDGTQYWKDVPEYRKSKIREILLSKTKTKEISMEEYINITSEIVI